MRRKGFRRLLWAVLVTNLLTNVLLLGGAGGLAYFVLAQSATGDAGGAGGEGGDPFPPEPDWTRPAGDPADDDPGQPELARMRVSEAEWARLAAGEALRETGRGAGRVHIRARFLVRAEPDALFDFLADPDVLVEVYDDLDAAEVRQRVSDGENRYDVVWFKGSTGPLGLEYTLRRDYEPGRSIRWSLIEGPGTSQLLSMCRGGWFFMPSGVRGQTLVEYRNLLSLKGLPDSLLEQLIDGNLPHTMEVIRGRVER